MRRVKSFKRRDFLKAGVAGAAGLGVASHLLPGSLMGSTNRNSYRPPNILFIITDDQKLNSFGFLGGKAATSPIDRLLHAFGFRQGKALTPNIDRLAAEGVYFSRAYTATSLCTPSRFNCLTGKYASRCETESFKNQSSLEGQTRVLWNTEIGPDRINLPQVLSKAGYVTGIVGKCHALTRAPYKMMPIDADPSDPKISALLRENQAKLVEDAKRNGFDYAASLHHGNLNEVPCMAVRQHNIEWTVKGALDFITQHKNQPFFLYFATTLMHSPSPWQSLNSDPRITEAGLLDEPLDVQPSRQSVLERAKAAGVPNYLAPALWLDDGIGAMLNKLDELGLSDNTLVFYFNDQGTEGGKGTCYEGGVRTPTIIRLKGSFEPGVSDALIQNVDFAPTILDACGIVPPKELHLDGVSIMPILNNREKEVHDSLYFEVGYTRAVATRKWKYLAFRFPPSQQKNRAERQEMLQEYYNEWKKLGVAVKHSGKDPDAPFGHLGIVPGGGLTERQGIKKYGKNYYDIDQLYDLENDPDEQNNLAGDPAYKDKLAEMKALLKLYISRLPGTFAEFKKA